MEGQRHEPDCDITRMPPPVKPSEAELAAMRANAARQQRVPAASEWQTEKLGTQNFQGVSAELVTPTLDH